MIRLLPLVLLLLPGVALADAATDAATASAALTEAVTALKGATDAKDRVASLTQTIKAYEAGLSSLRGALRNAELREVIGAALHDLFITFAAEKDCDFCH